METMLNPANAPTDICSRLPDDIVLEILRKVIDLKSLCFCKLVSRRFNRIVNNVDTVCFSYRKPFCKKQPLRFLRLKPFKFLLGGESRDDLEIDPFDIKPFRSAYTSMCSFRELRNLCIQLPTCVKVINEDDRRNLFKWKVKYRKNKVDAFVILSPDSIYDNNGLLLYSGRGVVNTGQEERDNDQLVLKISGLVTYCFSDMLARIWVLINCAVDFPLLEKVSVTHSDKKGTVCLGGEKLTELRSKGACYPEEYLMEMLRTGFPLTRMNWCFVPLLELPVSGYVMKGATFFIVTMADDHHDVVIDRFINDNDDDDDFEDKLEAAYSGAMKQILKQHEELLLEWLDV